MFNFGGGEMVIVLLIILLLFGPSQLPKMAKGFGQAIREFKKAQREITDEFQRDEPPSPPSPPSPQSPPSPPSPTRPPDDRPLG